MNPNVDKEINIRSNMHIVDDRKDSYKKNFKEVTNDIKDSYLGENLPSVERTSKIGRINQKHINKSLAGKKP